MSKKELEIISEGITFPKFYGRDAVGGGHLYLDKNGMPCSAPYVFRKEPCDDCGKHVPVRAGICKDCDALGKLQKDIEQAAKDAAEKTDAELGVH